MEKDPARAHVYCLYCFAEYVGSPRAGERCGRCGRRFVPTDWRRYWTRAPDLVANERIAKRVILAVALLVCGSVILFGDIVTATLGGWALAVPLVLAALSWASAGAWTQRGSGRLRVAWYALAVLLAIAFGVEPALARRWGTAGIAFGGAALIAVCTYGATHDIERTRTERIERGRTGRGSGGSSGFPTE